MSSKITVPKILAFYREKKRLAVVTAYDYTTASLIDSLEKIDIILVGDSLGSVLQGHANTLPVTLEQMIYHTSCVVKGVKRALVVADMPFMSYQPSLECAISAAGALLQKGGAAAVKLEGGVNAADKIKAIVNCDIPVIGHVGLTPQSYHQFGGHKIQGTKTGSGYGSASKVLEDALAVEEAGAFALVLEGIPPELAGKITKRVKIPTIGIGAGAKCGGQVLVINDLLGLTEETPSFVKRYVEFARELKKAVGQYADEVKNGIFPRALLDQKRFNKDKDV
jgi:3-methyl-2-oxobutanoate hydroxymethyltransferase